MRFVKIPTAVQRLFPAVWWRERQSTSPILYLTFDDGPDAAATPFVLETLRNYAAKATFFCIGEKAAAHPTLLQQIAEQGHRIGNHSYSHRNGWHCNTTDYVQDVQKASLYITSSLFRPPYGKLTWGQYRQLKKTHRIVLWDVMSYDFDSSLPPQQCLQQVLRHARNGSCIVFHDTLHCLPRLQYCLPALLKHYTAQGFRFEAVP